MRIEGWGNDGKLLGKLLWLHLDMNTCMEVNKLYGTSACTHIELGVQSSLISW